MIDQPVQVSSSTHPSSTTWYPISGQAAITASWSAPSGLTNAAYDGYWVRLTRSTDADPLGDGSGWTWTTATQSLFTKDSSGQLLGPGVYYVHVIGVDHAGNPSKSAGTRQFLLGPAPAKVTLYGYVQTSGGAAVNGATVVLQPFGRVGTTDANGYFLLSNVYEGTYAVSLIKGAASHDTSVVVNGQVSPWTVVFPGL